MTRKAREEHAVTKDELKEGEAADIERWGYIAVSSGIVGRAQDRSRFRNVHAAPFDFLPDEGVGCALAC